MSTFILGDLTFNTETKSKILKEEIVLLKEGEVSEYRIKITFTESISPDCYIITWEEPQRNCFAFWSSKAGFVKNITPEWFIRREESRTASGMPLIALYNKANGNEITIALSDPSNATTLSVGAVEENASLRFQIDLFAALCPTMKEYETVIRIDRRKIPFTETVANVREWWKELGYKNAYVPEAATEPMYSTWYSFHQDVEPLSIIEECRIAKEMGMDSVIVDDGWQTDDNSRGYAYCGDWKVSEKKIPDMKAFVDNVHSLGMKFMLWFSVPFIGVRSQNYERFKGMYLRSVPNLSAMVLDPRFKEVRNFLADTYCSYIKDYGIDGLKLDFIDEFKLTEESSNAYGKMDCLSVEEGVRKLLKEVTEKARTIDPEFMFEFRQTYVGPIVGQYGNIFRVTDCPNDAISNRIGAINLRLTSGKTAVHSDMLTWHKEDSVQSVAYQCLSVLFTVPQISVRFKEISDEQRKFLSHYLSFWKTHKEVLLSGKFEAFGAEANYSMAISRKDGESISVLHLPVVYMQGEETVQYVFNASGTDGVFVKLSTACVYEIFNVFGEKIETDNLRAGFYELKVPDGGFVKLLPTNKMKAVIFDLDGVIVTTDDCHYRAWKKMANEESIYFDREINERLRGVSRMVSLEIILERATKTYSDKEKAELATRKNGYYVEFIQELTPADILLGVIENIDKLKVNGIKVAIGSSSKNTPTILRQIGLSTYFDAVSDGNNITRSKPDPEVFVKAADMLGIAYDECIVVEDADAGIQAGKAAGMKTLAVGNAKGGDYSYRSLADVDLMSLV